MKAIMISGLPRWTALIMNGKKTKEIRKNKALETAIQKLIDEYGYAEIYWYCSKGVHHLVKPQGYDTYLLFTNRAVKSADETSLNGKVLFKFRCYKVEKITKYQSLNPLYSIPACLTGKEWCNYLGDKIGYAINISNLEIFDKPKELSEFRNWKRFDCYNADFDYTTTEYRQIRLTKAPQNFCYVEVER